MNVAPVIRRGLDDVGQVRTEKDGYDRSGESGIGPIVEVPGNLLFAAFGGGRRGSECAAIYGGCVVVHNVPAKTPPKGGTTSPPEGGNYKPTKPRLKAELQTYASPSAS